MSKKIERQADSLNEALKRREATQEQHVHHEGEPLALDDSERVKVLSPGRLVAKRFFRNKLAIVGLAILIFMFVFTFLFPLFYPYSQTQIFYKYGTMNANYASATERTDFVSYAIGDAISVPSTVKNSMNSYINQMTADGLEELQVTDANGTMYTVTKLADTIYTLSADDLTGVAVYSGSSLVAEYDTIHGSFTYAVEEEVIVPDDLEEEMSPLRMQTPRPRMKVRPKRRHSRPPLNRLPSRRSTQGRRALLRAEPAIPSRWWSRTVTRSRARAPRS